MNRVDRWVSDLRRTLDTAAELASRGRDAYDADPALQLAFEALASRVGEIAKRLRAAEPERFGREIWALAARNRDFVVHHYDRVDADVLWNTVTRDLPAIAAELDDGRAPTQ